MDLDDEAAGFLPTVATVTVPIDVGISITQSPFGGVPAHPAIPQTKKDELLCLIAMRQSFEMASEIAVVGRRQHAVSDVRQPDGIFDRLMRRLSPQRIGGQVVRLRRMRIDIDENARSWPTRFSSPRCPKELSRLERQRNGLAIIVGPIVVCGSAGASSQSLRLGPRSHLGGDCLRDGKLRHRN